MFLFFSNRLGCFGSLIVSLALTAMVYGVTVHDPATFTVVPLLLGLISVLAAVVPLRYIRLEETRISAAPGERAGVGIDTDAPRTRWILRRGSSIVSRGAAGSVIRLRAPQRPGTYILVATAGGHSARGLVFVRRR